MSTLHIQKCISLLKNNIGVRKEFCKLVNTIAQLPIGKPLKNITEAKENDRIIGNVNAKSALTIQAFEIELLKRGEVYNPNYKTPTQQ